MDLVQLNTGAELLIRTITWGVCLTVLTLHPIISDQHPSEKKCTITTETVVQGDSLEVPLNTSKTVSDLWFWNNLTERWDFVWDFTKGLRYDSSFKEDVSVVDGTFRLLNVSNDASGSYKLQDNDGNCVALINVSVKDPETTNDLLYSSAPGLTYLSVTTRNHRLHWVFVFLLFGALLFML